MWLDFSPPKSMNQKWNRYIRDNMQFLDFILNWPGIDFWLSLIIDLVEDCFIFLCTYKMKVKNPIPRGKIWLWMIWNKMWQIVVIWSIDCFADFLSQCLCFLQYSLAHWHIIKPWSFPSLAIHFFSTNNFMLYWFYFFRFHSIHCQMSIYFATTFAFCVAVITN